MTDEIIRTENLKKSFGQLEVLKGISTTIRRGEVVSIIGPSGGGKSTFLRCLNLLEQPTEGKVYFKGQDITDKKLNTSKFRQRMGMVFQNFNVFPNMTVLDNVTLAPILEKKVPKAQAQEEALALLRRVGLEEKANEYPRKLSGGQKQRLAIARVIIRESEIYVFDDSFSALDFTTDAKLRRALKENMADASKIIVAQRVGTIMDADRIIVLDEGKIAGMGTHRELLETCTVYREIAQSQLSEEDLA